MAGISKNNGDYARVMKGFKSFNMSHRVLQLQWRIQPVAAMSVEKMVEGDLLDQLWESLLSKESQNFQFVRRGFVGFLCSLKFSYIEAFSVP